MRQLRGIAMENATEMLGFATTIRLTKSDKSALGLLAKKRGASQSKLLRLAVAAFIKRAEEEALEPRLQTLEKAAARTARRVEDVYTLVKAVEKADLNIRATEQQKLSDRMAHNYEGVAEAVSANSAVVSALVEEMSVVREGIRDTQTRLNNQAALLVAIIHGSADKGVRASFLALQRALHDGSGSLEGFLTDAMRRGA